MNESLNTLLHADPLVLAALSAFIGTCGWSLKQITTASVAALKEWSETRRKMVEARAAEQTAKGEATRLAAEATRLEAEAAKKASENTGRFLNLAEGDRKQVESLIKDVRKELRRCDEDRRDQGEKIVELENHVRELEEEAVKQRDRIKQLESANTALMQELAEIHRSINSGGAYAAPDSKPETEIRVTVTEQQ